MKHTIQAAALALSLAGAFAVPAFAQATSAPAPIAGDQLAARVQSNESASLRAYETNTNPAIVVPMTGPYDQSDQFLGPNGYPLPGEGTTAEPQF